MLGRFHGREGCREGTMELDYLTIGFAANLRSDHSDPYLLFACRTRFDEAFRHSSGCHRGECSGCTKCDGCAYFANFSQALAQDPEAVRLHQKPPLPFVFGFPILRGELNPAAPIEFSLTLLGGAVQHLPTYLAAVQRLIDGLGGTLLEARAVAPGGGSRPVSVSGAEREPLPILSARDLSGEPLSPERLTLRFRTPVLLIKEGRALKELEFAPIARSLMRRASALACYYGGADLSLDFRWLSERSDLVVAEASECSFVESGRRVSGVLGSVTFTGELEPFHRLLLLGEVVHLGKGASFGQGEFSIQR